MTDKIAVSRRFLQEFQDYCQIYNLTNKEISILKNDVRADFERVGGFITKSVRAYSWMLVTWGYLPSVELLCGYLASKRIFIDEKRYGFMILATMCYDASQTQ